MIVNPPKYMNPEQLHQELLAAGFTYTISLKGSEIPLEQTQTAVRPIEEVITPAEMKAADETTLESVVNAHVGMRDKTDAEYAVEFQDSNTTAVRRQEIRDQQSGLLPREQVPMP